MTKSRRLKLQEELETLMNNERVYFQPPEGFKMGYPCIVYSLNVIKSKKADNKNYFAKPSYTVTYITKDPDDEMIYKILDAFTQVSMNRQFKSNNLYHNVYNINY